LLSAAVLVIQHRETIGLKVLAALINGLGLVAIALWIGWEAVERLQSPPVEILSLPMLVTASVGLESTASISSYCTKIAIMTSTSREPFCMFLADAASSIGVILAAIAVWALNWLWADAVITLFVSGLIILSATPLIVQSLNALFAKSPE
jgi:cobalt-zinc-cadmium efflux system protein